MIYGLYLSATGVLTNSHRQDVIANNLANAETVGFKRSLATIQQRRIESQENPGNTDAQLDRTLENIGGGTLLAPTYVDRTQGTLEQTGQNLDVAVNGSGFIAVKGDGGETRLTRDGRLMLDRDGQLILADGSKHPVLDNNGNPIVLPGGVPASQISIEKDGSITAQGQLAGRIGLFDVPDPQKLQLLGGNLLSSPEQDVRKLPAATSEFQTGYVEASNVDPMTELTQLINSQRQLEANANMIRIQDGTLGKLVSEVGKIG